MRESDYELGYSLGSEFDLSVGVVLAAPVEYSLEDSSIILLDLVIGNSVGTRELCSVLNSLCTMGVLMIVSLEEYLVGLSLMLPLVYPLGSPNHVYFLAGMLLTALLGLWFGSEVVKCCFSCCHLVDFLKATYGRIDIFIAVGVHSR